jgi:hypothetical protein
MSAVSLGRYICETLLSETRVIGSWEAKLPEPFTPTVNRQVKSIFLAVEIH